MRALVFVLIAVVVAFGGWLAWAIRIGKAPWLGP